MTPAETRVRSRHSAQPTAWSRVALEFVVRAEALGLPRAALLGRAGIRPGELAATDGRIPLTCLYSLLEEMVHASDDPLVHMRAARAFDVGSLDVLAFVVMTSENLRAGLRMLLKYQRVWSEGERYELVEGRSWARLVYHPWGPPRLAHALMAEAFAVDTVVNAQAITGGPFEGARVLLAGRAPRDRERHRALLGGLRAEFEQPRSEVWFRASELDRPLASQRQQPLRAYFERCLEERVSALGPDSTAGRARAVLMRDLRNEPGLVGLARDLRMSARTLQRRLAAEGTSLRVLMRDVRRSRAIELLEAGRPIGEIAYLLGYLDASAFHHAFRRWTGQSPEVFRRRTRVD